MLTQPWTAAHCVVQKAGLFAAIAILAIIAIVGLRSVWQNNDSEYVESQNQFREAVSVPGEVLDRIEPAASGSMSESKSMSAVAPVPGSLALILREASNGAPLSGLYGPGDLDKFSELRAALPGNSAIPAVKTPSELANLAREKRELHAIHGRIYSNSASTEEIQRYFANQKKTALDTIELAAYLESRAPEDRKGVFRSLRTAAEQMSLLCDEDQQRALAGRY